MFNNNSRVGLALFFSMITNVQADIYTAYQSAMMTAKNSTAINRKKEKQTPEVTDNLLKDIENIVTIMSDLNELMTIKTLEETLSFELNEIIHIQTQIAETIKHCNDFFGSLHNDLGLNHMGNINKIRSSLVTTLAETLSIMEQIRYKEQDKLSKSYVLVIDQNRMNDAIKSKTIVGKKGLSREEMRKYIIDNAS